MMPSRLSPAGLIGRQTTRFISLQQRPGSCAPGFIFRCICTNRTNSGFVLASSSVYRKPWPVPVISLISSSTTMTKYQLLPRRTFISSATRLNTAESQLTSKTSNEVAESEGPKDVVIYEQGTPDYFKKLSFLSVLQLIFFGVTAFTFGGLRDAPVKKPEQREETAEEIFDRLTVSEKETPETEDLPFWRRTNLGDPKIKSTLQTGSVALGYIFLIGTWVFIFRHVHFIVLRKDPRSATLVTYAPFGRHRYVNVLVNEVSAEGSRTDRLFPSMKLRVKGHAMTYKIDLRNGRFRKPELFDSTVGRRRNFD